MRLWRIFTAILAALTSIGLASCSQYSPAGAIHSVLESRRCDPAYAYSIGEESRAIGGAGERKVCWDVGQLGSPLNKSNVNRKKEGATCLLISAVLYDRIDRFRELISLGADPRLCGTVFGMDFPDYFSRNVISSDCRKSTIEWLNLFREIGIGPQSFERAYFSALNEGCFSAAEWALEQGAMPSPNSREAVEALCRATSSASDSNIRVIQMLVKSGVDPVTSVCLPNNESPKNQAKRLLSSTRNWERVENALSASK